MAWSGVIPISQADFDRSQVVISNVLFNMTDRVTRTGDVTAVISMPKPYVSLYEAGEVPSKVKFGLVDTWNNPNVEDPSTLPTVRGMVALDSTYGEMIAITEDGRLSFHGNIDRNRVLFDLAVTIEYISGKTERRIVKTSIVNSEHGIAIPTE